MFFFSGINLKVTSPQSLNSEKHEKESIELEVSYFYSSPKINS